MNAPTPSIDDARATRRGSALAGLLVPLLLGACTGPSIHTARSPSASFASYRTYAHGPPEKAPQGFARTALTPVVWGFVQPDLDRELGQKGYKLAGAGAEPDLVVRSGSGSRPVERDEAAMARENVDWVGPEFVDYTEATLVIDVLDARTRKLVWHGSSRRALDAPAARESSIAESVHAILRTFPSAAPTP